VLVPPSVDDRAMNVQCAIVCLGAQQALAAALAAGVAQLSEFGCSRDERMLESADVLLFVAERAALPELLDRIAHQRRSRPTCAIVAAGREFAERDILAIFGAGAHDFVSDRVESDELGARLRHALGHVLPETPPLRASLRPPMRDFVGQSPAFMNQIAQMPTMAGCDAGVLILGETGTGKEICAQAIHYMSARASKPWIAVNCGAIAVELIESELFGHVRGAYTTAHTSREGLVAEAEGGTLFLDDIDCLPLPAQSKLLRFLQEREYRVVGSNAVRHVDVRVIAASNRDLVTLAARGAFRQDLYFRLNVLTLTLPPLRERREDIVPLAMHFIDSMAHKYGRPVPALTPMAVRTLLAHDWPGNVRELQHVIERTVLLAKGPTIAVDEVHIHGIAEAPPPAESFQDAKFRVVEQFERMYIEQLLITCDGNVTHAAREAKKNRRAFFELIRKHRIEPQRFRALK